MADRTRILEIVSGRQRGLLAGVIRAGLGCLTPIYRLAINFRNQKFERAIKSPDSRLIRQAGIPVISVGNLTTGGTGKTPLVIWICKRLRERNWRVAIVSRGYGSDQGPNDEALEMEHRLPDVPHLQDPDRYRMARIAVDELDSQVVVLDDGFQHRQLDRDLDLVLIDATEPFGFNRVLPRGLLREPVSSLRRADVVIITRTNLVTAAQIEGILRRIAPFTKGRPIAQTRTVAQNLLQFDGQQFDLDELRELPVFLFCGIGNSDNFDRSVKELGAIVQGHLHFPDHHAYDREDLQRIGTLAIESNAAAIVCTHKDLVKVGVNRIKGIPVYAIVIDVEFICGEEEFIECVESIVINSTAKQ